jgi:GDPmannose 4,6-dehydratase
VSPSGRRVLITGVSGQDGWYTASACVARGDEVVGTVRPGSSAPVPDVALVEADLATPSSLAGAVRSVEPTHVFHLAAPTFVPASWDDPSGVLREIAEATASLLRACREAGARVWVATSSEVFGDCGESPQGERTPMRPRSPYGVAKLAAHGLVGAMRERHGLFACSGITFNHESPRRPERFLPRKVTRGAAAIALGRSSELVLGSLDAVRDWSHAEDVAACALLALEAAEPGDYVVASGEGRTVRDLVDAAFAASGLGDASPYLRVDPAFVRPPEPCPSIGDPSKARSTLGWSPRWTFEATIAEMVEADLAELRAT